MMAGFFDQRLAREPQSRQVAEIGQAVGQRAIRR